MLFRPRELVAAFAFWPDPLLILLVKVLSNLFNLYQTGLLITRRSQKAVRSRKAGLSGSHCEQVRYILAIMLGEIDNSM